MTKSLGKVFEALASTPRRQILAYLTEAELSTTELAERFAMTAPAISRHLSVLEEAELVSSERRGQFVFYKINSENLVNSLTGYAFELCPTGRPLPDPKPGGGRTCVELVQSPVPPLPAQDTPAGQRAEQRAGCDPTCVPDQRECCGRLAAVQAIDGRRNAADEQSRTCASEGRSRRRKVTHDEQHGKKTGHG